MSTRVLLEKKVKEIYDILEHFDAKDQNLGVLAGTSGISLFQFYYSRLTDDDAAADRGVETITQTIQEINNGYAFPTFCTGIAGAGWVLELLNEEEFIDIDSDELLADLDDYLAKTMIGDITKGDYDFLHGAIGYGFYFLKRYQNTNSDLLKARYKEHILSLIKSLGDTSKVEDNKRYWKTTLNKEDGLVGINLSLSHGLSSIINFLSRVYVHDDFKNHAHDLLVQTTNYILSHKYHDLTNATLYPSWIYDEMQEKPTGRLAWCYGDLGIGLSLWKAGEALQNQQYKEEAIHVMKHATKRRDIEEAGLKDSGLCHGTCGVASIYDYMYKQTNEPLFKESADFWLDQLLKMDIHDGNAGYMQWMGTEKKWQEETNLLEGIAGIGLAMISFLATFDTKWEECLMIG